MGNPFDNRPGSPIARRGGQGAGFDPSLHPDEQQFARLRRAIETNSIPLALLVELLDRRSAPVQLNNTPRTYQDVAGFTPGILIEMNTQRAGFIVVNSNETANVFISYGYPVTDFAGNLLGIPLTPLTTFQEANGTISIDDIYAWSDTAATTILAYESVIAIAGENG